MLIILPNVYLKHCEWSSNCEYLFICQCYKSKVKEVYHLLSNIWWLNTKKSDQIFIWTTGGYFHEYYKLLANLKAGQAHKEE